MSVQSHQDDLRRWAIRRRKIAAYYAETKSLSKTAEKFGLTRARISQIVKREREVMASSSPPAAPIADHPSG